MITEKWVRATQQRAMLAESVTFPAEFVRDLCAGWLKMHERIKVLDAEKWHVQVDASEEMGLRMNAEEENAALLAEVAALRKVADAARETLADIQKIVSEQGVAESHEAFLRRRALVDVLDAAKRVEEVKP
jgi:hypothetical protein